MCVYQNFHHSNVIFTLWKVRTMIFAPGYGKVDPDRITKIKENRIRIGSD